MTDNLDKTSVKILVLGDSGVGKSSLIHLICHSTVLNSVQCTIGCSIDVKLHDNYYLEFWDIGGSRGHKIARSFLYQDYHGIILVFDATNKKSRVNLDEWLNDVMQNKNDKDLNTLLNVNFPIITIATKKDLLPYGTILDSSAIGGSSGSSRSSSSTGYNEDDCSVVNLSANEQNFGLQHYQSTNLPMNNNNNNFALYRRHQASSSYTMPPLFPSSFQSQMHSTSSNNLSYQSSTTSYTSSNEPLLKNEVIYVNTQEALSFDPGSRNYQKLNNFFKHVIDRRNKKF